MRETGEQQENILEVRDLQLAFLGVNGRVEALRGVNLAVAAGEIVALVGESGSGKTALCRAALGLHANHAVIEHGGIWLAGQDTSTLTEKDWCALRGRVASMVFQDPMSAFDPVYPIGQQIAEVLLLHPACFAGSGIEKRTAAAAPRLCIRQVLWTEDQRAKRSACRRMKPAKQSACHAMRCGQIYVRKQTALLSKTIRAAGRKSRCCRESDKSRKRK